jgi:hypothetical protein
MKIKIVTGYYGDCIYKNILLENLEEYTTRHNYELISKFDNWEYDDAGVEERMPWYTSNGEPTLTTNVNGFNDNAWWGTLVSTTNYFNPAPYMANYNANPGIIWYWVR